MKITIECDEKVLYLIQHTLELYARLSMCQLKELSQINSIQKLISSSVQRDYFEEKIDEIKSVSFDLGPGSYHGIGSKKLDDDARIAFDLYQTIRNELWKSKNEVSTGRLEGYAADTCKMSGMVSPNFKLTIK